MFFTQLHNIVVEAIQHEILETPVTVYNFEVAEFHTYYVGNNAVLVHNLCKQQLVAGEKSGWNARDSVDKSGSIIAGSLPRPGKKIVNSAGKELARSLRNDPIIKAALDKALEMISKGW